MLQAHFRIVMRSCVEHVVEMRVHHSRCPKLSYLVIFHFNTSDWYLGVCPGFLVQWLDIAKKTRGSYVIV